MISLKKLQKIVYQNKLDKGFNTTNVPLEFCLLHEEVSEAFHAYIKKHQDFGEELADIAIYILGIAQITGVNLEKEIKDKIEINHNRRYIKVNGVLEKASV